ncbi:type II secretion system major pseudopilin GspG [Ralstonia solanacearum]|uniref:type II secretion system major pseudopilin GspG n=1 Tax=Ralstonia solanacearum TaxID=305 RepID=UPI002349731D|nr:type II secretion system major pseudopilin GspG [Ralstonia solanacearum]MDC6258787.1 type II secretion system major pseudopilin GspG [Ralstonia solanacearum]
MLIVHEGLPGAGKTWEAVVKRLIPALQKGRKVYARINGLDHAKIAEVAGVELERVKELLYPSTEEGLDALNTKPQNQPRWSGPYLKKAVPLDPWDRPYVYRSPGEHGEYDLYSLGKNGQPGGVGESATVTSW